MLRLNMATPVTQRNSADFSSLGIINAAVRGLTDPQYNNTNIQFIPNMDGFPNGRRLEDDVTRIELQAVSGVALAAIGLWYDDYLPGQTPVTQHLINVLTYTTGVEANDVPFRNRFPYVALPHAGDSDCAGTLAQNQPSRGMEGITGAASTQLRSANTAENMEVTAYPNPFTSAVQFNYTVKEAGNVNITVFDQSGKMVQLVADAYQEAGTYETRFEAAQLPAGIYYGRIQAGGTMQIVKLFKK